MNIKKIFNNNVLLADNNGHEVVLIGKGLGFQKKSGQSIDESAVDKMYTPTEDRWLTLFDELINDISPQYFEVASQIIKKAEKTLNTKFNAYMLIALTDHIHFAIQRTKDKVVIRNELLWEIQHFYPTEYAVGKEALQLINQIFGVNLVDDEAGFIALKFVENRASSQYQTDKGVQMTNLIGDILTIVQYQLQVHLDEESISYQRFMVHLRFFVEKMTSNKKNISVEETDDVLYAHIFKKYPVAFNCTKKITQFIKSTLNKNVSLNEQVYVTIHIQRIINDMNQNV
ncbi:BglG family transcription antiterminator LicT [Leuconostoc miyukkimchii]|uniref:BglG family transcription antiterminator LicT n=1 Tax=Leuconostoc miyukkimchii TaxID=910540 RepID=UPI001C7D4AF0|nr:PRD domain-containing protein [Leuconostoc miyukkimchii]